MTRSYYDEFSKLSVTQMPQAIADMTYAYNETQVPAKHYKEMLGKQFEELMEAQASVKLVDVLFSTLSSLQKESPRLFFQALLLLDLGIKPKGLTAQQYQAMSVTADKFEQDKKAKMLDKDILGLFNNILKNGVLYKMKEEDND
ncbi:hypothetical protein ESZ50_00610 [Weissella muntiaci]|uniref:Uncharacterized protein n=1 Tax=Weissella muntiaci TaxID=2508881 RepID=A0A6C2CAD0_9LACO|nr:hypothetical protein [Weissella muntiaci]TYC51110.1 hypothetical protein ESZ50_00610 [Weissella muntiaci]